MSPEEIITDDEMIKAFGSANFGLDKRTVLKHAVLKVASGYYQGHTSKLIATELNLINEKYELTPKGRTYLWASCSTENF